jgi:hypothetical protein
MTEGGKIYATLKIISKEPDQLSSELLLIVSRRATALTARLSHQCCAMRIVRPEPSVTPISDLFRLECCQKKKTRFRTWIPDVHSRSRSAGPFNHRSIRVREPRCVITLLEFLSSLERLFGSGPRISESPAVVFVQIVQKALTQVWKYKRVVLEKSDKLFVKDKWN